VPRVLLSGGLHPQEEEADVDDAVRVVPVVAVEAARVEVARDEAVAVREEGIGRDVVLERDGLTYALEVRENECEKQSDGAETLVVLDRHGVLVPQESTVMQHLLCRLVRAVRSQTRHPEHERIRGRLVIEVPALQVGEILVARSGLRSMQLEREPLPHLPSHGAGVAERDGVIAPGQYLDFGRLFFVIVLFHKDIYGLSVILG